MKILITGANGFVGQNLMQYLSASGFTCCKFLRSDYDLLPELVESDVIIHLAGKAHDLKNTANPEEYFSINYGLTRKLYDAFLKSNSKKFIFISSVKASADTVDGILTEEQVPIPKTVYGESKLRAEEYILQKQHDDHKSYYILRPCMIHGSGNKGNLNLLYKLVRKGIPYPLAAFQNKRSYLSIDNLSFIIKELITQKDVPSGIYNVADDKPLSTNEVVFILSNSLGSRARLLYFPKILTEWIAKVGDVLKLPLTTERLKKMTESYVVSNDKIKSVLKVDLPHSAEQGMLKTAISFKNRN